MNKLSRIGIVVLLMLGALTACMGDGTGADMDGEIQGVPGTVAPDEMGTSTVTP